MKISEAISTIDDIILQIEKFKAESQDSINPSRSWLFFQFNYNENKAFIEYCQRLVKALKGLKKNLEFSETTDVSFTQAQLVVITLGRVPIGKNINEEKQNKISNIVMPFQVACGIVYRVHQDLKEVCKGYGLSIS